MKYEKAVKICFKSLHDLNINVKVVFAILFY